MYSMVLLMALNSSTDLPACGRHHGHCHSCAVCYSCCDWYAPCGSTPPAATAPAGPGTAPTTPPDTADPKDAPLTAAEEKQWTDFLESLKDVPDKQKEQKDNWEKKTNSEKRAFLKALKEAGKLPGPARIIVSLPADAVLTIDGKATTSTSATRTFQSPVLQGGYSYSYQLTAEVVRNGRRVVVSTKVNILPGNVTKVTLEEGSASGLVWK